MIFASSMTWRSIDRRVARRYCSTERSCCGSARTTTTPDWGVTMTEVPGPVPTMARSAVRRSAQKSLFCCVVTRLDSSPRFELVGPASVGVVVWAVSVTAPELTRMSEMPRRWPGR